MPLHFEVQTKQGQRADYLASVQPPKRYPCFILVFNWDWTDYEYHTWFCLFYFASEADRRMIGELKLMNSEQDNTMDALPEEFDEPLDDSFCSLGIKTNYYIGLRQELKNEQLIKEVQHYLCDCTFEPSIYDKHRGERIFNLNSATVSINRLSDSKLSLWCLGALFDCCISRDKPFHPLTPPSDLRQYAVENRQEIRISQSLY